MLVLVPTVKTPVSVLDFARAFIKVWYKNYGSMPTKNSIAVIYGQWGVETGPSTYLWNYNIANVKAVDDHNPNTTIQYQMLPNTWEIVGGKRVVYQPPSPVTWFRAFSSLEEGVQFYFDFLRNRRYHFAWGAVEQGDPAQFSHLLKMAGYYTADESAYTNLIRYHYNKFMQMNAFEAAFAEFQNDSNQIEFPTEYQPIDLEKFSTKEDIFIKPEKLLFDNPNIVVKMINIIKNIFKK